MNTEIGKSVRSVSLLGPTMVAVVGLSVALAACGPEDAADRPGPAGEAEVASTESALVQAATTNLVPWSVMLWSNGGCTGTVLSQHWILTAGHCFDDQGSFLNNLLVSWAPNTDGNPTQIYNSTAVRAPHGSRDVALLFLRRSGGLGNWATPASRRAEVYTRAPWFSGNDPWCYPNLQNDRNFEVVGWGRGSDPGGTASCDNGVFGRKRIRYAFWLDESSCASSNVYARTRDICRGDSGSPWLLRRGGRFLAFAVHHGDSWRLSSPLSIQEKATRIGPLLSWIGSESERINPYLALRTTTHNASDGTQYVTFHEVDVAPPSPSPPPSIPGTGGCPSGHTCCEPGLTSCRLCVPPGRVCQ